MYLKKIYFPLVFIAVIVSCSPGEKTTQKSKVTKDTVRTNMAVEKSSDELPKDVEISVVDTTAVLNTFKKTVKTDHFIKELEIDDPDGLGGSVFDSERPILIGDLDGDHLDDAIMPFSIEGRQGGNNWDAHYAIFINNGGKLEYKYSFSRGGDLAEIQIDFKSIEDGVIKGMEVPGIHSPEGESKPIDFMYRNIGLSELLTASETK